MPLVLNLIIAAAIACAWIALGLMVLARPENREP